MVKFSISKENFELTSGGNFKVRIKSNEKNFDEILSLFLPLKSEKKLTIKPGSIRFEN